MSLNIAAITPYVKENAKNIISRSILGMESLKYLTVQPNIKSSENLTNIVTQASLQAGSCGWSPSGVTTLGKRTITVTDIMSQESICMKILENTLFQLIATAGTIAGNENFVLEQAYMDNKILTIQEQLESDIWAGTVVGGRFFDGLLEVINTDVVPLGVSNVIARTGSIIDDIDSLIALLPKGALKAKDLHIYLDSANYLKLMIEVRDKNWFHVTTGDSQKMEYVYPGTNIKVVGVNGFDGDNSIVLASKSNLVIGTDLAGDFETAKFWYSEDNLEHRFHMNFRLGNQIAIPAEVVVAQ